MLGEVAPVIPEVPLAAIGLAALASLLLAIGLRQLWSLTLGALLELLARALDIKVWRIHLHIGRVFDAANDRILDALGRWILSSEQALGWWWHTQKKLAEWTWDSMVWLADSTADTLEKLVSVTIPQTAGAVSRPIDQRLGRLAGTVAAAQLATIRLIARQARALEAELELTFGRAWRGIDQLRGVELPRLARRLAATAAGVLALRRLLHRDVLARLRRVERLVLGGALTGAVIAVLTRQMPWYRCRNVQRFMRGVCRSPFGSLDWLFALAALVVVALDPVRMLHLAEDAEDELSAIIARMAGVVRG